MLIAQAEGQPVDFRFGGIRKVVLLAQAEVTSDTQVKLGHIFVGERIAQRQHSLRVSQLGKTVCWGGPNLVARTIGTFQLRERRFHAEIALF